MRLGIKTAPQNAEWSSILDVWREADQIEAFESAWVFDHFYPIFTDPTGPCLEGWVALTALAQATNRIQIGSMVNGAPYRHPAVVANMASTLDIVSGGRLQLGLGAGWNQEEAGAYGISLGTSLTERCDMFDEATEVIVSLLSNEHTTFDGEHYQLTDARNEPKGPQRPHPPIVIGAAGEKRTLRTVARFAQHWNLGRADVEIWKHKRSVLDAHCAEVGRDPAEIMNSVQIPHSTEDDPQQHVDLIGELEQAGVDLVIFTLRPPFTPSVLAGLAELSSL